MQSVIKNIQDYDISRHQKAEMAEIIKMHGLQKDQMIPDNDQNFEDSPKQTMKSWDNQSFFGLNFKNKRHSWFSVCGNLSILELTI